MTREEAIRRMECCRNFLANNYSDMGEPNITAFNMAIKALEQEPCEDAISREQAISAIRNLYPGRPFVKLNLKKWQEKNKKYFECEDIIKALPSVTPTPKKGKWIYDYSNPVSTFYHCSECGRKLAMFNDYCQTLSDYPYCHCGAEMESEE